jgi:hypothetical protein
MKRILLPLVPFALAAVTATELNAQRRLVPYFGGGLASASGDLGEGTDSGWIVFGGLDWGIAAVPGLSIGVTVSYTSLPYTGYDNDLSMPGVFGELGYLIGATSSSKVKPYLRAGVGELWHKYDPGDLAPNAKTEGEFGFGGGGGLSFVLGSSSLFAGAHYTYGTDDTEFWAFYAGLGFPGRARATLRNR